MKALLLTVFTLLIATTAYIWAMIFILETLRNDGWGDIITPVFLSSTHTTAFLKTDRNLELRP